MKVNPKYIFYVLISLLVIFLTFCGVVSVKYYSLSKTSGTIKILNTPALPENRDILLGNIVNMSCEAELPWNISPKDVALKAGKGSQQVSHALIRLSGISWGKWKWKISFAVQPFRTGVIPEGKCSIRFTDDTVKTVNIPKFVVKGIRTKSSKLELAPDIKNSESESSKKRIITIIGIVLICILIAAALWWWKKHEKQKNELKLPLWSIALSDIKELRELFKKGMLSGEICVSRLTDIVRQYLEGYLNIKAEAKTTPEFLQFLNREESPLNEHHKAFLQEFLNAADLVKFAKLPADNRIIEDAIDKANKLVHETIKQQDKEKDKKDV